MSENPEEKESEEENESDIVSQISRVILFLAGAAAAIVMVYAGIQMIHIQSLLGGTPNTTLTSTAEVYYHAMGWGFIGLGIFGGGLLVGLALRK